MVEQGVGEANFSVYHDLMARKVREILLVSSPYDAFLLEEDGRLASRIINEYQGLNLSRPPRLHRASSGQEALELLHNFTYDLVITMPQVDDMDACGLADLIRQHWPGLPVIFLAHHPRALPAAMAGEACALPGNSYIWTGDAELLLAIIKNVEDHLNVDQDTRQAKVRVLLMVEDSPVYASYLLPLLYREVVRQTQAVLAESLNEEHRLLKMRARPKILVAQSFEKAQALYTRYKPFLLGVISDMRFPRQGCLDNDAGLLFFESIRKESGDLPLLMLSSGAENRQRAEALPALFADKNSELLGEEIHDFFLNHLGFGDFVFRLPDGAVVGWAGNLREFEEKLAEIPAESLRYHAGRNHFVNWVMARSEVEAAKEIWRARAETADDVERLRSFLIARIHGLRRHRQYGVIAQFSAEEYDPAIMDFARIGAGSLGGKARGLAFMAHLLMGRSSLPEILRTHPIAFPKTMVIASEGFDSFVAENGLQPPGEEIPDRELAAIFLAGRVPGWLVEQLTVFLERFTRPLAVRSSSLQEDAFYKPYAGLFQTYMLPNSHPDPAVRLRQLLQAVQLIYASTWFAGPRAYARRQGQSLGGDSMAVIVQELVGARTGDFFYPAISGVAQSCNYYPVAGLKAEDGVAHVALGMGKAVVEGERSLRFSPAHPQVLPQFATVEDVLASVQQSFYGLDMRREGTNLGYDTNANLTRLLVKDAESHFAVQQLSSTYVPEEHRIRDGRHKGARVLTFAPVLKYGIFPLPSILSVITGLGRQGMGVPVEIEFACDLRPDANASRFYFLQIRPMVAGGGSADSAISAQEEQAAFCLSHQALGHGSHHLQDIVYVRPEAFEASRTVDIAREISRMNGKLLKEKRPYLLIGPGRWGSADPWLGIPVEWQDISGVGGMVEIRGQGIQAEPSEGTHFFQNITSLGIPYLTVQEKVDKLDWDWLKGRPLVQESTFLHHVRCQSPVLVKLDWRKSRGVLIAGAE